MKHLILALLLVGVLGCATSAKRLNKLSPGMSPTEVVEVMGDPVSTKINGNVQIYEYKLDDGEIMTNPYWITFTDGKLTSTGRAGDWSTPTRQLIIQNR